MSELDILRLLFPYLLLHWHPEQHLLKQANTLVLAEVDLAADGQAADTPTLWKRGADVCREQ